MFRFLFFQVFIPNEVKLFGSAYQKIELKTQERKWDDFEQDIFITKSHIKALDQSSQRCTKKEVNVNHCILSFIEKQIGCKPKIQGSNYSNGASCDTVDQLEDLAALSKIFEEADGNDIYEATGCLAPCDKDLFSLSHGLLTGRSSDTYHVQFKILDRAYEEREQYVIYDLSSFIADVGGYMGLLLGCSLASLYYDLEAFLQRILCRPRARSTKNC